MTVTAIFADSFPTASAERRSYGRLPALHSLSGRLPARAGRRARTTGACGTPPGAIGAALIRAARRRAKLSQRGLARRMAVNWVTVSGWEAGSTPLYCTDFGQLRQLAAALSPASGDEHQLLHELLLASQCDLLLTGILRGFEDYAEVPPIDEDTTDGETTRDLLRWALAGAVPAAHGKHASAGRLLDPEDVTRIREVALLVQAGTQGDDLRVFGCTLAMLTNPCRGEGART